MVAIGDFALDLRALARTGALRSEGLDACQGTRLNEFMALDGAIWSALRRDLSHLLSVGAAEQSAVAPCLIPRAKLEFALPATVGDFTDFYTSIHHATNIGKLFRPDQPRLPNYEWVPLGYHGRSSSLNVSGQCFPRPRSQFKRAEQPTPVVEPCRRLDHELEISIFIGGHNAPGEPIPIDQADEQIFGLCLLNDWSARDIQAWEYQPLGPFLAKNFASTLSPWIVTAEALAPFRTTFQRPAERPPPLPYLRSVQNTAQGAFDVQLEVFIQTQSMRENGWTPERLSRSNYADAFWTAAQLITHHTVNGCNLRAGDLLGSGTMSGATPASQGAMIELTDGGDPPLTLRSGEQRTFLEDGDAVTFRGRCAREGFVSIGFGECAGTVLPARSI